MRPWVYYTRSTGGAAVAYNAPCSPQRNRTPLALGGGKDVCTQTTEWATCCCCSVAINRGPLAVARRFWRPTAGGYIDQPPVSPPPLP